MWRLTVLAVALQIQTLSGAAQPAALRLDQFGDPLPSGAVARFGSSRLRPGGYVRGLAFSPDDKRLASWSDVGLCIWDTNDGRELRRVRLPYLKLEEMRWLANGRGFAVFWSDPQSLFAWEFTDSHAQLPPVKTDKFRGPVDEQKISAVAISPDGKWLAVGRRSRLKEPRPIELYPLTPNQTIIGLKPRVIGEQPGYCTHLVFSPDSQTLFAFSRTQKPDRAEPSKLEGVPLPGEFDDREHLIARNVASGAELASLIVPVVCETFLHESIAAIDSNRLAIGHADGKIRIWDCEARNESAVFDAHRSFLRGIGGVRSLAMSNDGKLLVSAGASDTVFKRWDIKAKQELPSIPCGDLRWPLLQLSNNQTLLAAGDTAIRLWKMPEGEPIPSPKGHTRGIGAIHIGPGGEVATSAGSDRSIRTWELKTGVERKFIQTGLILPRSARFADDGSTLIVTDPYQLRNDTEFFDVQTGQNKRLTDLVLPAARGAPRPAVLSALRHPEKKVLGPPSHGALVVSEWTKDIDVFGWPSGNLQRKLLLPKRGGFLSPYWPRLAAVAPNSSTIAIIGDYSGDKARKEFFVGLWNNESSECIAHRTTVESEYRHMSFTPDESGLILAGGREQLVIGDDISKTKANKALVLVDPPTANIICEFVPPEIDADDQREITTFTISPDGRLLAAAERDHTIWVYELKSGQVRNKFRGHNSRVTALAFTPDSQRLVSGSDDCNALVWDASLTAAGEVGLKPQAADFDKLWAALARPEWQIAGPVMATLVAHPDVAMDMIQSRMKPIESPSAGRFEELVNLLDSPKFAEREQATKDLRAMGSAIKDGLLRRANDTKSAEVRDRLRLIATGLKVAPKAALLSEFQLREFRAIEILERNGSPAARAHLRAIAKGAPGAFLTETAAAAFKRSGH